MLTISTLQYTQFKIQSNCLHRQEIGTTSIGQAWKRLNHGICAYNIADGVPNGECGNNIQQNI
jgi:hypothetical protein